MRGAYSYAGQICARRGMDQRSVGGVLINLVSTYRVDQMRYGGVKSSVLGRDGVRSAIEELADPKLIVLNLTDPE